MPGVAECRSRSSRYAANAPHAEHGADGASAAHGAGAGAGRGGPGKARRRLGMVLMGCGAVMLPWLVVLAVTLPGSYRSAHWALAWVGLDGLEAAALLATGWLVWRGDPWRCLPATAAAVLLTVDAWFDMTTAAPGHDQAVAIAMAVFPELPVAAFCAVLAVRSLPSRGDRQRSLHVWTLPDTKCSRECPGGKP